MATQPSKHQTLPPPLCPLPRSFHYNNPRLVSFQPGLIKSTMLVVVVASLPCCGHELTTPHHTPWCQLCREVCPLPPQPFGGNSQHSLTIEMCQWLVNLDDPVFNRAGCRGRDMDTSTLSTHTTGLFGKYSHADVEGGWWWSRDTNCEEDDKSIDARSHSKYLPSKLL